MIGSPFPLGSGITAIYNSKSGWHNKVTMTTLNTTSFLVLFSKKMAARFPEMSGGEETRKLSEKAVNKNTVKTTKTLMNV